MQNCTMFIGLDVHKDSIDVALAPEGREEVRSYGKIPGDMDAVDKLLRKFKSTHGKRAKSIRATHSKKSGDCWNRERA